MTRRFLILAVIAAIACASTAADKPKKDAKTANEMGNFSSAAGDKPVGVIPDAVLRDEKRHRDVAMSIEYPISAGAYPLIIWSHGFGGSDRGYVGLSSYWASNGYVVIKPNHADSGKLPSVRSVEEIWESQTVADYRNRVQDVTAILDGIAQLEESYPELKGKIDATKVGVGGHSYGAHTAMLVGGAKTFPDGTSYADPRVKVILAMSPQGPSDQRGLTKESFATLTVPALFMTGTLDNGISEAETPDWRKQAYELSPAGDKYLVVLKGARHLTFAGRVAGMAETMGVTDIVMTDTDPLIDPRRVPYNPSTATIQNRKVPKQDPQLTERAVFGRVKTISIAFWDAYLHGNVKGKEFLEKLAGRDNVEMVKK